MAVLCLIMAIIFATNPVWLADNIYIIIANTMLMFGYVLLKLELRITELKEEISNLKKEGK